MNNNSNLNKIFFHIDVNSAFLSWTAVRMLCDGEQTDIRTIPAIIGGDSSSRHGIVLAKSIPCKKYGIQTAEPIAMALRKCPTLKIYPPEFNTYKNNSHKMMDYIKSFCPDVEQVSIDECYMDYTPIAHKYNNPLDCAVAIKDGIKSNFGFTVNIGISDRKVLAKMASDFSKPDKIHTLFHNEIKQKMWPLPVSNLFMCGKSSTSVLHRLGIVTIGDLALTSKEIININLKSIGCMLHDFANGIDDSTIYTEREREKSISHAHTLEHDVTTHDEAHQIIKTLSDDLAKKVRKSGFKTLNITIEIKYSDFSNVSHQRMLLSYTDNAGDICNCACELFDSLWNKEPVRLLGIRASHLAQKNEPMQLSIFDCSDTMQNKKKEALDKALDTIRDKYGENAVKRLGQENL